MLIQLSSVSMAATDFAHVLSALDWRGMFPLTIGSSAMVSGSLPDTPNPSNPVCVCAGHPFLHVGWSEGFWEPMMVVEVTRTAGELIAFNGVHIPTPFAKGQGSSGTSPARGQQNGFYQVHVYRVPIIEWVAPFLLGGSCQTDGDFSVAYASEWDPTWQQDTLSNALYPEVAWFREPEAAVTANLACGADALSSMTGLANDHLFWCDGSHGLMYPLTGSVGNVVGQANAESLMVERALYKLHRMLMMTDSSSDSLCHPVMEAYLPKSRYREEPVYPVVGQTRPFGRSVFLNPLSFTSAQNDDAVFWVFRKKNCCNY